MQKPNNNSREFALDVETQALFSELNAALKRDADAAATAAAQPYLQQIRGAMQLIVRTNQLPGDWGMSPDGTKLIRQDAEPQADFTKKSTRNKR